VAKKSPEQKVAADQLEFEKIKFYAETVVKLLQNPLVAGLAGYMAVSAASNIKRDDGTPYMSDTAKNALKGIAVGYPLGGWPGLAAGSAVFLSGSQSDNGGSLFGLPKQFDPIPNTWQDLLLGAWNPFK